ncbi:MAG: hypothetical protein IKZ98_03685 [Clostridia bacterium]|nr:hypothetical protein [Clostridia bacterium]
MFTQPRIRFVTILLAALLTVTFLPVSAVCETNLDVTVGEDGFLTDDTWQYAGYTFGGITFAIPANSYQLEISQEYREAGIVLLIGNEDYMLQLRKFAPEVITYEQFKTAIQAEPSADVRTEERDGKEILIYRNTNPNAYGELFGIVMTGTDGNTYKISLFTGESEAYEEDAPVWKIAEIIAETTNYRDFSQWGIPTTENE